SKIGTMRTTPSSFATFCIVSVVGPGIASARSKRSHCCDLQKYSALNSSLRQTICAPRDAASRMRPTAASTFLATSSTASSWMMPTVNGADMSEKLNESDHDVVDVRSRIALRDQRIPRGARAMRSVHGECSARIAAGGGDRAPRRRVHHRAGRVGGAVAAVGSGSEQRDAFGGTARVVEDARGGERELLTSSTARR